MTQVTNKQHPITPLLEIKMKKNNLSTLPVFVDHGNNLACPNCGNGFLHHSAVFVIDRKEDAEKAKAVAVEGLSDFEYWPSKLGIYNDATNFQNPSPRRGAIIIEFDCECCDAKPQLAIYQHKGCTVVEWYSFYYAETEPRSQRKPIKKSVRFQILKRDGYQCQMCGVTAKDGATLQIDHILPVSRGGSNDASNLQVLCRDCNAGKSDSLQ